MFVYEKHELNDKKHDVKIINFHALKNALLKIISSRMIWQAGFIGCALYLSLSLLAEQWGNTYIQKIIHGNAESASIYVDMIFFGWFIGSPLHGYLSEKFASRKRILIYGSVSSLLAFLPLILWPTALSHLLLGTLLFLFGFFSSAQINCFAVARDFVETQLTATAVGFMNACVMVGGMIIQPLYGFTLDALSASDYHTMHVTMRYTLMDYRLALIIIPIFILLALIIACLMKDSYKKAA